MKLFLSVVDEYSQNGKLGRMSSGILAEVAKDIERNTCMQGSLRDNLSLECQDDEIQRFELEKVKDLQKQFTLSRL